MNKKGIKKLLVAFSLLFINTSFIYADGICSTQSIAKIVKLVSIIINIIRIAVPIILIFSLMIKLISSIMKDKGIEDLKKPMLYNIIDAVLIFLIPFFVNVVTKLTGTYEKYQECLKLASNTEIIDDPHGDDPEDDPHGDDPHDTDSKSPKITSLSNKGSFVTVSASSGNGGAIVGYFFSKTNSKPNINDEHWVDTNKGKLEIAKIPGTYYVFVKDKSNNISESKKMTITFEDLYNTGATSRKYSAYSANTSELTHTLNQSELNEYNEFIANSVKSAGLFTNEGVVTAGAAAIFYLYVKYNTQIPYNCNISCAGTRYNVYFGINPKLGNFIAQPGSAKAKECKGTNNGFDCQSYVGWSIHNGGFKAHNTAGSYHGDYATYCRGNSCSKVAAFDMYKSLEPGDIIYSDAHKMLVAGHFDGGLYVFEAASPVGISKFTYEQLYSGGNPKAYTSAMRMRKYYSNPQNYACLQDGNGKIVPVPEAWKDKASLFRTDCKA